MAWAAAFLAYLSPKPPTRPATANTISEHWINSSLRTCFFISSIALFPFSINTSLEIFAVYLASDTKASDCKKSWEVIKSDSYHLARVSAIPATKYSTGESITNLGSVIKKLACCRKCSVFPSESPFSLYITESGVHGAQLLVKVGITPNGTFATFAA